ncbi:quinoprotein dehydrogenase-associated SoxYZ-like carrier [Prosthecomicrobium sp. N25]|uniref:quinoprotein dehydrogenase-associated SoxYZ-like carrier n=1 Tax=Prosthecomicrobium sp. N25 TaxID=3129254 RepID=UPI003077A3C4
MAPVKHAKSVLKSVAAAGALALSLGLAAMPASAGTWDELKPSVFGDRAIADGQGIVSFTAPYRAEDDRRVPVSATAAFTDGRTVKGVSFIIDENPMPVAAAFKFQEGRDKVGLGIDVRLNGPSMVRVVVEASDGRLYMAESMVKTSGLGACAAPPVGDAVSALQTLGNMQVTGLPAKADSPFTRHARLKIQHPQHTGMQMNQITLLYIPARYVAEVEVREGAEPVFTVETGFAMSEDPRIDFDYKINGTDVLTVRMKDTDGAVFQKAFPRGVGG